MYGNLVIVQTVSNISLIGCYVLIFLIPDFPSKVALSSNEGKLSTHRSISFSAFPSACFNTFTKLPPNFCNQHQKIFCKKQHKTSFMDMQDWWLDIQTAKFISVHVWLHTMEIRNTIHPFNAPSQNSLDYDNICLLPVLVWFLLDANTPVFLQTWASGVECQNAALVGIALC